MTRTGKFIFDIVDLKYMMKSKRKNDAQEKDEAAFDYCQRVYEEIEKDDPIENFWLEAVNNVRDEQVKKISNIIKKDMTEEERKTEVKKIISEPIRVKILNAFRHLIIEKCVGMFTNVEINEFLKKKGLWSIVPP